MSSTAQDIIDQWIRQQAMEGVGHIDRSSAKGLLPGLITFADEEGVSEDDILSTIGGDPEGYIVNGITAMRKDDDSESANEDE